MASIPLAPPYRGQSDQLPVISTQWPFCERMQNFNNLDSFVKLRQGNDLWATITDSGYIALSLNSYGSELFLLLGTGLGDWRWYDVTASGTGTLDHSDTASGPAPAVFYFNSNIIYCFAQSGRVELYNGTTWTSDPYTFSSLSPYGGTEFKKRAYFIGYNTATYGYSGISSIAGAVTNVDLAALITSKASLYLIRPISLTQNLTAESVLAFIFSSGEILVYGGSYPDSPTWTLLSTFKVSKPIKYNAYVEAKGDTFLFTQSEILSLRNLFISGYDNERDKGIGAAIKKRWRQCIQAYINAGAVIGLLTGLNFIKGVYDEKNDRIIISMPKYVDPDTGAIVAGVAFQLIYDFNLEAWYEYTQTDDNIALVTGAAFFNNDLYYCALLATGVGYVVKIEGATAFVDDQLDGTGTNPIAYKLKSAPLPVSKFGVNAIGGIEAICKSDLYPQTSYKIIADLGRAESAGQTLPAQGATIQKPMMNVGFQDATVAQVQISGSSVSASIGLELYAFNIWFNKGQEGSR